MTNFELSLISKYFKNDVFDDFPKILEHFPKSIFEDSLRLIQRPHERLRILLEAFLPIHSRVLQPK